jgi:hypothetical protein
MAKEMNFPILKIDSRLGVCCRSDWGASTGIRGRVGYGPDATGFRF